MQQCPIVDGSGAFFVSLPAFFGMACRKSIFYISAFEKYYVRDKKGFVTFVLLFFKAN